MTLGESRLRVVAVVLISLKRPAFCSDYDDDVDLSHMTVSSCLRHSDSNYFWRIYSASGVCLSTVRRQSQVYFVLEIGHLAPFMHRYTHLLRSCVPGSDVALTICD